MRKIALAFVVGSSFPVVLWPFLYHGLPFLYNGLSESGFLGTALGFPIVMGLLNVLFLAIQRGLPFSENMNYWLYGAVQGFLFSLYGNFVLHLPTEHFLFEGTVQYITIPFATIVYALIWRYIIRNLNHAFQIHS